jgi:predicted nucleic acid-binding protein
MGYAIVVCDSAQAENDCDSATRTLTVLDAAICGMVPACLAKAPSCGKIGACEFISMRAVSNAPWMIEHSLASTSKQKAEAVLTILRLVESGDLELLSSEVLQFEIARIPDTHRQERAGEMLKLASQVLSLVDEMEALAESCVKAGIKPIDALHLVSASWAKADYFCTCDDRLLKKSKKLKNLATKVVSPLELIAEVTS